MKINLKNLDKAIVLMLLYNASKTQGNSFLGGNGASMTKEEATKHLETSSDFDYLNGKVMKINLKGDLLETWLYDRDNGDGAALKAIQAHYPDVVEVTEAEAVEVKETVILTVHEEPTEINNIQAIGRMKRKKNKKKKVNLPVTKIEYNKGFFTVNGKVCKETKLQQKNRIVNKVGELADVGFKVKIQKNKK